MIPVLCVSAALMNVIPAIERRKWEAVKDAGKRLFAPELRGSYEVFNARPMSAAIIAYCTQDVTCMPRLYARYMAVMSTIWQEKVAVETVKRLAMCRQYDYDGKSWEKARGPANWQ